jgi:hypothetical protein
MLDQAFDSCYDSFRCQSDKVLIKYLIISWKYFTKVVDFSQLHWYDYSCCYRDSRVLNRQNKSKKLLTVIC